MGKKKFYAVRKGKVPGIYQTWHQAEEQVKGFSGAEYRSFGTLEEADAYMSSDNVNLSNQNNIANSEILKEIENLSEDQVIAFVDGSYSPNIDGKEKYGFGAILITNETETSLYKAFVNSEKIQSCNVAGEIEGVKQSILWALNNNKKEIIIYYDYEGIKKWATKEWEAKKTISREYSTFIEDRSRLINIIFRKVQAHSGIEYNEKADELAKRSLLSQGYKTYNDGSIYFYGFNVTDWIEIINVMPEEFVDKDRIKTEIIDSKEYLKKIVVTYNCDKVVINCYRGSKSYVQGKQSVLFQNIIQYAIEKLPNKNAVIETLNYYHALSIDETEVERKFREMLPNFPERFQDAKHYNTLLSAVYNTMLTGYMPDYTCLIHPVFRAIEYYLHRILHNKLGKNTVYENGSNKFNYFSKDQSSGRYYYNSSYNELSDDQIILLNEFYNFYNKIRHPFSHWSLHSIDSAVITSMTVARDYIKEGLNLVNNYYIIF